MNKPTWLIASVFITAGAVGLVLRQRSIDRSRAEIVALQASSADLPRLRDEHRRLLKRADELARNGQAQKLILLRQRVEAFRHANPSGTAAVSVGEASKAHPEMRRAETWQNLGRATTRATLETSLWAAAQGDLATLAQTIRLEADARTEAETLLSTMPADIRAQYDSPEKFVALLLAAEAPLGSMQVVSENLLGSDRARLEVLMADTDSDPEARTVVFHQDASGWMLVVNVKLVTKVGRLIR